MKVLMMVLALPALALLAQDRSGVPGQPPPPQDEGERRRPPGPPGMPPGGGGGGATMIAHDGHLFIFANGTLYKIEPKEMKVVGELQVIKGAPKVRRPEGGDPQPPPPPHERDR